jgi:hypothetical protein
MHLAIHRMDVLAMHLAMHMVWQLCSDYPAIAVSFALNGPRLACAGHACCVVVARMMCLHSLQHQAINTDLAAGLDTCLAATNATDCNRWNVGGAVVVMVVVVGGGGGR